MQCHDLIHRQLQQSLAHSDLCYTHHTQPCATRTFYSNRELICHVKVPNTGIPHITNRFHSKFAKSFIQNSIYKTHNVIYSGLVPKPAHNNLFKP